MPITFFNLRELERRSKNSKEFLLILKDTTSTDPFYNNKYKAPSVLKGDSYILDLKSLLEDKTTDPLYKVHYIRLAALRNFLYYKHYKDSTLDLGLYPDINMENILKNPLLINHKHKLKFKYEEITNGKSFY